MEFEAVTIAVLNTIQYLAESLALALTQQSGYEAFAVTLANPALLLNFSIILIDLDLGLESALQMTLEVTAQRPEAKVVLLGLVESKENVLKIADAGASGYVRSGASLKEVVSVVDSVQQGEFTCPPDITYALFSHLADMARHNASAALQNAGLTIRERRVMELMSRLSNKEIAERLCISQYTVKNHVHHILKKLGARSRGFAVGLPVGLKVSQFRPVVTRSAKLIERTAPILRRLVGNE
jgi:DNA-binding NarL/FixJ family response regulator